MRYISICSGIEAATVAWASLGWTPICFAEIDPFPCAVLAHHYPNIPNLGDISKVDWRPYAGQADVVVGGTPCQSFSIAGKRDGLDGASGLVREYFRLLREVRPRWFVWENVPGALSSGNGEDFNFILKQWDDIGYHIAWRVLDAQYFGVPQRRRRIFAVGHFGNWRYPATVLFESESLSGNPAPSRKTGQDAPSVAGTISGTGFTPSSFGGYREGVGTLRAAGGDLSLGSETLIAKCLTSSSQRLDSETETLLPIMMRNREGKDGGGKGLLLSDKSLTLACNNDQVLFQNLSVRRLTPLECERLQGFPDNYTRIPYRGKSADECPDGPRYKALGNSMCVNVMRWIGERITRVDKP